MSLILDGTNGVSDIDGTAATPAIRGTDTNTGIFFPAADTIAFAEGGTEVARFDSSGRLGIGTTTPAMNLVVKGSTGIAAERDVDTDRLISTYNNINCYANATGANNYNPLTFTQSNNSGSNERMRIDSSGNVLVGTTSSYGSGVGLCGFADGTAALRLKRGSDYGATARFYNFSTSEVGSITVNASSTAYVTSSDYRLKENIAPMTGALDVVQQLKPVTYNWKIDGSDGQGFIAHELQAVVPDAVTGEKDAVELVDIKDEEGNVIGQEEKPVYQGIDTSFLVATLTAAIQELKATVDAQAARIAALENPPVESVTNE